MSHIFVSGVNGFIGSHLAERLINMGHCIRGLVRKTSDLKLIEGLDIELAYGDITDRNSLDGALNGVDILVHVAGLASDWGPHKEFFAVNVTGTQNIAELAHMNRVKRFVHISTTALHGFKDFRNIDETFPMAKTIFPYCETKKMAEQWLFEFAKSINMDITAIRPGNVYGPRDHKFIEKYLNILCSGKAGYIDGGQHWTCPTYVENLVDGIVKACFEPSAIGQAFFITDGLEITWKTFTEEFADELGVKRPKLSLPFWFGYILALNMEMVYKVLRIESPPLLTRYRICNGGRDFHFSIEKARRLLKFEPLIEFKEAVRRTVSWYLQRDTTPTWKCNC